MARTIAAMPEPDDGGSEERLNRVERDVASLREDVTLARTDAAAARILAAAADQDVAAVRAELRGHTQVLNALRETQLEQQAEIHEFKTEMREFKAEMLGFQAESHLFQTEMRDFKAETQANFASVNAGLAHVVSLVERLAKVRRSDA
jgi:chromosome segregation ATPase